jgi:hypothetical protein
VKGLVAKDARPDAVANKEGVHGQHGQRAYRKTLINYSLNEPATAAEASKLYAKEFAANHFKATGDPSISKPKATGGFTMTVRIPGQISAPKQPTRSDTLTFTINTVIPDDATLIADGRKALPNPGRYTINLTSSHASSGVTTRTVVAERVVAYLHHGELDASPHQHFDRPESDPRFFATSTFSPTPPPRPVGRVHRLHQKGRSHEHVRNLSAAHPRWHRARRSGFGSSEARHRDAVQPGHAFALTPAASRDR